MPKSPSDYINQLAEDMTRLKRRNQELETQLIAALKGLVPDPSTYTSEMIFIETGVTQAGKPFITWKCATTIVQMDLPEAYEILNHFHQSIEAAISDSFVFAFMRDEVNFSPQQAGQIMHQFRSFRDQFNRPTKHDESQSPNHSPDA